MNQDDEIAKLKQRLEALEKYSERYKYLRESHHATEGNPIIYAWVGNELVRYVYEKADEAIDKAINQPKPRRNIDYTGGDGKRTPRRHTTR